MAKKTLRYWRSQCLAEGATPAHHYRALNKKSLKANLEAGGYKQGADGNYTNGTHSYGKPAVVEVGFDTTLDLLQAAVTGNLNETAYVPPVAAAPAVAAPAAVPAAAPAAEVAAPAAAPAA